MEHTDCISAGAAHGLALTSGGRIVAWGYDGDGRCSRQPALAAGETFSSISAGGSHSLALTSTVLKVPHDDGNVKVPAEVAYGECPWMEVRSRLHVS